MDFLQDRSESVVVGGVHSEDPLPVLGRNGWDVDVNLAEHLMHGGEEMLQLFAVQVEKWLAKPGRLRGQNDGPRVPVDVGPAEVDATVVVHDELVLMSAKPGQCYQVVDLLSHGAGRLLDHGVDVD